jgi:hypothetical protein
MVAAAVTVMATSSAHADEKQACIAAAEDGQQLRIDAKLKAARARFVACARAECPTQVRRDCSQWMSEVMSALPTIVLGARDAEGRDTVAASVSIDGLIVTGGLDGKPLEVDPGMHVVRFEPRGALLPIEQQLVVREGEKGRPVVVTFVAAQGPHGPAPPAASPSRAHLEVPAPQASLAVSPWTWDLGGVGVIAVGVGTYLEVSANADASSLASTCHHNCSTDQVDPLILKQRVLGPIAFGLGAVSLGLAVYTGFAKSSAAPGSARTSLAWSVVPSPRGALGGVVGIF